MIEISELKMDELDEFMSLWHAEADFHRKLDPVYYKEAVEDRSYVQNAIEKNDPNIFIAKDSGKIIGFITCEIGKADYSDTNIEEFGEVLELYVSLEARGKGVARQLMEAAEKFFLEKGVKWSKLYCSTFNHNALEFYEKIGYENRQSVLFKSIKD